MPVYFNIRVTKRILEQSKECGNPGRHEIIGENCAIALALKDLFPGVSVTDYYIYPLGTNEGHTMQDLKIELPKVARDFIKVFDSLAAVPRVRPLLPEFEFDILIPDEVISRVNIDEINDLVKENSRGSLIF